MRNIGNICETIESWNADALVIVHDSKQKQRVRRNFFSASPQWYPALMQIYRRQRFFKIGRCSRRRCVINAHLTLQTYRPRLAAASALADIFIVIIFPFLFYVKLMKIAPAASWIIYEIRDRNDVNDNFSSMIPCKRYEIMRVVLWTTRVRDCCMTFSAKENGGLELWLTNDFIRIDALDFINLT